MKLTATIRLKSKYQGRSKFEFMKNLKEGDILVVEHELKHLGGASSNGNYTPVLRLRHIEDDTVRFSATQGDMLKYLSKLDYEEFI